MGKDRASELDRVPDHEVGLWLGGEVERFLDSLNVPRGLSKVGYAKSDVERVGRLVFNHDR
jgi:hydroxyacid-oxoacid transhydrogenase